MRGTVSASILGGATPPRHLGRAQQVGGPRTLVHLPPRPATSGGRSRWAGRQAGRQAGPLGWLAVGSWLAVVVVGDWQLAVVIVVAVVVGVVVVCS
jgi:hypothetical protein